MTYHTRITESGELILSANVARALGLRPGDDIAVEPEASGATVKRVFPPTGVVQDNVDRFIAERADDWDD